MDSSRTMAFAAAAIGLVICMTSTAQTKPSARRTDDERLKTLSESTDARVELEESLFNKGKVDEEEVLIAMRHSVTEFISAKKYLKQVPNNANDSPPPWSDDMDIGRRVAFSNAKRMVQLLEPGLGPLWAEQSARFILASFGDAAHEAKLKNLGYMVYRDRINSPKGLIEFTWAVSGTPKQVWFGCTSLEAEKGVQPNVVAIFAMRPEPTYSFRSIPPIEGFTCLQVINYMVAPNVPRAASSAQP